MHVWLYALFFERTHKVDTRADVTKNIRSSVLQMVMGA